MEFERAAALRDRIRALTNVQSAQGINPRGVKEADVIALHMDGGQACVQVFFIRANQNWGNKDFFPRVGEDIEAAEVLVPPGAPEVGQSPAELGFRERHGVSIVGLARGPERLTPTPDTPLQARDVLVVVGPSHAIARFHRQPWL